MRVLVRLDYMQGTSPRMSAAVVIQHELQLGTAVIVVVNMAIVCSSLVYAKKNILDYFLAAFWQHLEVGSSHFGFAFL